jgi:hypothetical protein
MSADFDEQVLRILALLYKNRRSLPQRAIHRQNNKSCATIANDSLFIPLVPFQHFLRFAEKVLLDTRINKN